MERLSRFVRTTPAAFWLAILGVGFSLGVFVSGVFGEESPFALIVMFPAFLAIAVLTAFVKPVFRAIASAVAAAMTLVFASLVLGFATHPPITAPLFIHAVGTVIAAGAAVSAFRGAIRPRPLTPA